MFLELLNHEFSREFENHLGIPMDPSESTHAKCQYCGGTAFVHAVRLSQPAEAGDIGLQYKRAMIFINTETLYADLCTECGTIVRFFVKETNRQWRTG